LQQLNQKNQTANEALTFLNEELKQLSETSVTAEEALKQTGMRLRQRLQELSSQGVYLTTIAMLITKILKIN